MELYDKVQQARKFIQSRVEFKPEITVVLGSGLSFLEEQVDESVVVPYGEIPHFPPPTVSGHAGRAILGTLADSRVLLLCGRTHLYEGYSPREVTFPVRTAVALGSRFVVLTNAAGAISPRWRPGDIMFMTDHLNLQGGNVLAGPEEPRFGPRFIDMTNPYEPQLRARVCALARAQGITLRQGIYAALLGPSYETRAEIRMLGKMGADVVGMSTVQEAIAARQMGARIVGLSVVTNLAAGISAEPLSHEEVKETADRVQKTFGSVISMVIRTAHEMNARGQS